MFSILLFLILVHFFPAAETTLTEEVIYYTDSGLAEFTSSVPLHTFTGRSSHLTGMIDLQENIVDFYLDLNTLKTGIGRRDRDMYRTLNVDEYEFAEFTGTLESPFDENITGPQPVIVQGGFTLHGVTREIRIEGELLKQEDELHVTAEWIVLLNDYNLEPPGILFYRVTDEQEVRIEAVLHAQNRQDFTTTN